MKKLLYLTVWNFRDAKADGICKKILSQVKTLRKIGFEVDFAYTKDGAVYLKQKDKSKLLGRVPNSLNIILAHAILARFLKDKHYDAVYVRHCVISPFYIHLLSVLSQISDKVVVEFPTYPYDEEIRRGVRLRLGYYMDHMFRNKMKKYVDRVITFSEHDIIFGIPTISAINGVDVDSISQVKRVRNDSAINLIGVAMLSPWHGFDRVIEGLKDYYQNHPDIDVNFFIVGTGEEYEKYINMVNEFRLEQHVKFFGNQSGKNLDDIFEQADIAVASIAIHRKGLKKASSLKSREYGARGLPMLATSQIDYLPNDNPYVHIVPADESPIDISQVVDFVQNLEKNENMAEVSDKIRSYAKAKADMSVAFKPIGDYLMEGRL